MTSSVVTLPLTDAGAPPASEDDWGTDLRIPYFRAKGESERKAWQLARELGLDLTTILPAGIIGPGFSRPTPTIVKPPLLVLPTFVAPLLPAYDASEPARHHDRYNERQMAVRVVRLGTPRAEDEGLRIGTVRRPPRGVSKSEFARQNWYDVWFPNLAPSVETMKLGQRAATPAQWSAFFRKYRAEMAAPENSRAIALLAALSHQSNFSVGCYCEAESHCHRSVLRELLASHGARLRPPVR